jgi:hypothetical protein
MSCRAPHAAAFKLPVAVLLLFIAPLCDAQGRPETLSGEARWTKGPSICSSRRLDHPLPCLSAGCSNPLPSKWYGYVSPSPVIPANFSDCCAQCASSPPCYHLAYFQLGTTR